MKKNFTIIRVSTVMRHTIAFFIEISNLTQLRRTLFQISLEI